MTAATPGREELLALIEEIEINRRVGADQKFSETEAAVIEFALRLAAKPANDPADVWDAYCKEVPFNRRSPQGALAFGFWAATKPADEDVRETAERVVKVWQEARYGVSVGSFMERACSDLSAALSTTGEPKRTREGVCPSCGGHGVVRVHVADGPHMSIAERESYDNEGDE